MDDRETRSDDDLRRRLSAWAGADAAGRGRIEADIRGAYEEEIAILVLDMSQFSATVMKHGIIHFLAKVHEMRTVAVDAVAAHGGEVVKYIADDVLASFPTTDAALAAATDIVLDSKREDARAEDMRFGVAIGIGYGSTLHVPGVDLWGDEVNQAFKLGEDTGNAGEILLTRAAYQQVSGDKSAFEHLEIRVSGLLLEAYVLRP